jgi:hypothetical protein
VRGIDSINPDLNAVNEKLSAKNCIAEPSNVATPSDPAKAVFQNLRSELEGIPHAPNAPKIPSVDGVDSSKANNTGTDGVQATISKVEDQRERAILEACVRPDGLNHFISMAEIQALKALGIERMPVIALPEKYEKQGPILKLKLWGKKETAIVNLKDERKKGRNAAVVTSKKDIKLGEKKNELMNLAIKIFHNLSSVA